jgi:PAS domain S-box-containing protein
MRVQTKLTSLLLLLIVIISTGRFIYLAFETRQVNLMFKEISRNENEDLDELIKLKGSSLESFVKDYTYWDEMVSFVNNPDPNWATQMLDTSLATYKASGLWVYEKDFSLLYSIDSSGGKNGGALPLSKEDLNKLFARSPFCHFFLSTSSGVVEVRGASIHPTADADRKTQPQGYFFASRLWAKEYIQEIAKLARGKVAVFPAQKEVSGISVFPKKSKIIITKPLTGWDSKPVAYIYVQINSKEMASYGRFSQNAMVIFVVFAVSIVVFIMLFLRFSVSIPFKSVSQALNKENPEYLTGLDKDQGEFGDISRLIEKFFQQKKELLNEISERKIIEKTLKENEEYLASILNSLQAGVLVIDVKTHVIMYANPIAVKMIGVAKEKIVGFPCQKFICPADVGKCPITDLGQTVDNSERILIRANGEQVPIIKSVTFITLNGRRHLIENFIDISERKKAEEEIKKSYQATHNILERSPLGICVINDAGKFEYVNPAMLRISGDTYEQFSSLNVFELPTYKALGLSEKIKSALNGEYFSEKSVKYTSNFSKKTTIRNFLGMPFEESGKKKVLIFVEDITELKKLEETKDSLTHMIIHDLNNPLTALVGEMQLIKLESEDKLSESQKTGLETALAASDDLKRMINNLLDINKMEDGKITLHQENFQLEDLANQVVGQMKIVASNQNKSLLSEVADNMPAISADKEIIRRIIANLINNSLKFTPEDGTIVLKAFHKADENRFFIQVKDTGAGIPADYLDRIFEKFIQVEAKNARTGHGLGLTFCKMMVEVHGGKIWAESEGLNKGTAITFSLPGASILQNARV